MAGTPAALLPNWSLHNGYLVGPAADLASADLIGQDLSGLTLTGVDLNSATLENADVTGANLTSATLTGVNLTGADLAGATLAGAQSSGVNGTPSALPADWMLHGGFLIGPAADLAGQTLNSLDLSGADLTGAGLNTATLAGASFHDANLTDAVLAETNLTGDDLSGANLTDTGFDANLTSTDISGADITGTNFNYSTLTKANLDKATGSGATYIGVQWGDTICPDGTNSNAHVSGCFSAIAGPPPAIAVTGVSNGHSYLFGKVPTLGCRVENGTAVKPPVLTVTTTGSRGVGRFTATCAATVAAGGSQQKVSARAAYTVLYGMRVFIAPAPGSTIARSARVITVRLRLATAAGAPISAAAASALAAAGHIRATLQGPGISAVTAACRWNAADRYFTCTIKIPAKVKTGSRWRYTLTAAENVGPGFVHVPGVGGAADPEVVHFK